MSTKWLKFGSEKNVLNDLTNFTSYTGLNNCAIILSPEMSSGVSLLAFKGNEIPMTKTWTEANANTKT
jgi:hypothetical protein